MLREACFQAATCELVDTESPREVSRASRTGSCPISQASCRFVVSNRMAMISRVETCALCRYRAGNSLSSSMGSRCRRHTCVQKARRQRNEIHVCLRFFVKREF